MSLRAYITSFDLQKMQSLLGSRKESTVQTAAKILREEFDLDALDEDEAAEYAERIEAILAICRRAVDEGVPFPDLKEENEDHVTAAETLAVVGQKHGYTSFEDWKVTQAFYPLLHDYSAALSPRGRELLTFLDEGRPLFGRKLETGWSYYAYLTADEVKELHAALVALQESHPELKGEEYLGGFVESLVEALAGISRKRKARDLWLEAG